jgi:DNA-directed RNA polymerase specialized sigma24 family protein
MGLSAGGRRRWDLDKGAFEALLEALGPDREQAGARYEAVRARLLRFYTWRGARAPEELADEAFDRVSRRLAEGEVIRTADVGRYFLGVARNVLREAWDRDRRRGTAEALDDLGPLRVAAPAGRADAGDAALLCLDRCLEALAPETRNLVLHYYDLQGAMQTRHRQELAAKLGIGANALRLRLHRLRARLEDCVRECLEPGGETAPPPGPPSAKEARE